jgi:hypothetical protein
VSDPRAYACRGSLVLVNRDRPEDRRKEMGIMNKLLTIFLGLLIAALTVYSCATVPLTGRRQLSLVSDSS